MNTLRTLGLAAAFTLVGYQGAFAATYEAIYKGTTTFGTTTADVEADFFYDVSQGTVTNTTTPNPITEGGTLVDSHYQGTPDYESGRLYISTLGTYYLGSETSFSADYDEYPDIGQSAVSHRISGLDGTLSGSFLAPGASTIPANVADPIPLLTSGGGGGDYAITDGPSGGFTITSVEVDVTDVSSVPLPASAPLFGAAVVVLGALDRCFRRKSGAAGRAVSAA
jgi:hypothetical protein